MVSGDEFGEGDNVCYFTLFKSEIGNRDTWFLGSLLMEKYYTVFDMGPYEGVNKFDWI